MKNYTQMRRIFVDQWEDCSEWKKERLKFLLLLRNNNPSAYMSNKLGEEKEDFYIFSPETLKRLGL